MENKEWIERCNRLSKGLLLIDSVHPYAEDAIAFRHFIDEITGESDVIEKMEEEIGAEVIGKMDDLIGRIFNSAFSFGYVIGQMLDIPYLEAQADIEAIKQVIREKDLLPYLPRERKGHEEEGHQQAEEGG